MLPDSSLLGKLALFILWLFSSLDFGLFSSEKFLDFGLVLSLQFGLKLLLFHLLVFVLLALVNLIDWLPLEIFLTLLLLVQLLHESKVLSVAICVLSLLDLFGFQEISLGVSRLSVLPGLRDLAFLLKFQVKVVQLSSLTWVDGRTLLFAVGFPFVVNPLFSVNVVLPGLGLYFVLRAFHLSIQSFVIP